MEVFDLNTLPFGLPLIMASWARGTLDTPDESEYRRKPSFVEFSENEDDETISIQNSEDTSKRLVLGSGQQCFFDDEQDALKFTVKMSPAGRLVFEEHLTGRVLEIEYQGRTKLVVCRNKYLKETQSWYLLERKKLDASITSAAIFDPMRLIATIENEEARRRQLIMHYLRSGKSTEDVGEILTLIHGSAAPKDNEAPSDAIVTERRQQILKLLEAGKSATEVGEILTLLYGTSAILI